MLTCIISFDIAIGKFGLWNSFAMINDKIITIIALTSTNTYYLPDVTAICMIKG